MDNHRLPDFLRFPSAQLLDEMQVSMVSRMPPVQLKAYMSCLSTPQIRHPATPPKRNTRTKSASRQFQHACEACGEPSQAHLSFAAMSWLLRLPTCLQAQVVARCHALRVKDRDSSTQRYYSLLQQQHFGSCCTVRQCYVVSTAWRCRQAILHWQSSMSCMQRPGQSLQLVQLYKYSQACTQLEAAATGL